jgi:acetyl-CoA decarbonylase/synthase complex subunit gamma
LHANLYVDRIDLTRYAGGETCQVCHVDSIDELAVRLRSGQVRAGSCPHWPPERIRAFHYALNARENMPTVPSLSVPRPAEVGLFDLNEPTAESPVLVTGNSQLTHQILLAVLATTTVPLRLLSVDTGGHTVDMSLVYETLTPGAIAASLETDHSQIARRAGRIILPGLAEPLADPLADALHRHVEVGPVCAAELPLLLA